MKRWLSVALLRVAGFVFNAQIFLLVMRCRIRHPFDAVKQRRLYGELRLRKLAKRRAKGGLFPTLAAAEQRNLQSHAAFTTRFAEVPVEIQDARLEKAKAKRLRRAARSA